MVWNKITTPYENATVIELYAKQFDWTARYAGEDNTLGNSDFKVIESANPLGVVTSDLVKAKNEAWQKDIEALKLVIAEEGDLIPGSVKRVKKFTEK